MPSTTLAGEIITYQEKLGNYNLVTTIASNPLIITYQEKLGNYNVVETFNGLSKL